MASPRIILRGNGRVTVCCGEDSCADVEVEAGPLAQPQAATTVPPLVPTVLKPTIAYADLVAALDADRMDVVAGHIDQYVDRREGYFAMAVADGSDVRLDALNRVASSFGLTPVVVVGASVEVPAYA